MGVQSSYNPPSMLPLDFWRSQLGTTQPDGTTDVTEDVSRDGRVRIGGMGVAPAAQLEVAGLGTIRAASLPAPAPVATDKQLAVTVAGDFITRGLSKKVAGFTSGATDASGNVTVDMTSAGFTAIPAIGAAIGPGGPADLIECRITALTATSVTFNCQRSPAVTVLAVSVLAARVPAAGVIIQFVAVEK